MIDQATIDVSMGIDYIQHNFLDLSYETQYAGEVSQVLDHALHALHLSKSMSQNGYVATPTLTKLSVELMHTKDKLSAT